MTPIVGNEFSYVDYKYGSLERAVDGKQDLCETCMNTAQKAFYDARKDSESSVVSRSWEAVKEALR